MKKFFLTASVIASLMGSFAMWSCSSSSDSSSECLAVSGDSYVFEMDESAVSREHVTFKNRFGITIAADLYLPKNIDKNAKNIAVVMGAPYGGVKEQCAGLYASEIAKRGYVTVAFDHSYNGASGGTPRYTGSSEVFAEDYSAAIDYVGSLPYVNRQKIGIVGIGSSASFAMHSMKYDKRAKAMVCVSLLDLDRLCRFGVLDGEANGNAMARKISDWNEQRWIDVDSGRVNITDPVGPAQDSVPAGFDPIAADLFTYYGMKRGWHPRANGCFTKSSIVSFMGEISPADISPASIWFMAGEKAASKYMTEDVHRACREPKAIRIIPGATHVDLYDRTDIIPFDEIAIFFKGL